MREDATIDLTSEPKLASLSHPNIFKFCAIVGVPGHPKFLMVMEHLYSTMEDNIVPWKKDGIKVTWNMFKLTEWWAFMMWLGL
jgi:hypothetical protein